MTGIKTRLKAGLKTRLKAGTKTRLKAGITKDVLGRDRSEEMSWAVQVDSGYGED